MCMNSLKIFEVQCKCLFNGEEIFKKIPDVLERKGNSHPLKLPLAHIESIATPLIRKEIIAHPGQVEFSTMPLLSIAG